jgi:hypothetical protein
METAYHEDDLIQAVLGGVCLVLDFGVEYAKWG